MFRRFKKSLKNFGKFLKGIITSNFVVETAKTIVKKSRGLIEHGIFAIGTTIGFLALGIPGAIIGAGVTHAILNRKKTTFKAKSLPRKLFDTAITATGAGLGSALGITLAVAAGPLAPVAAIIGGAVGAIGGGILARSIVNTNKSTSLPRKIFNTTVTATGAGLGGTLGAALGIAAGPVGILIGGAIGAISGGIIGNKSAKGISKLKNLFTLSPSSANTFVQKTSTASSFLNLLTAPLRALGKALGCGCLIIVLLIFLTLVTIFSSFIIPRQKTEGEIPATSCFVLDSSFEIDSKGIATRNYLEIAIETLIAQYPALINLACQASSSGTITLIYAPDKVSYCGLRSGDIIYFRSYDNCTIGGASQAYSTNNFAHEITHIIQDLKSYKPIFLFIRGLEPPMSTYPVQPPPWYEDMAESVGYYVYCEIYNLGCHSLGPNHRRFVTNEIGSI